MTFRPMLGVLFEEQRLRFPYYASPKLDGLRCLVVEGQARTRSMRPFPNRYVDGWFTEQAELLANLDGELVVGDPTAADCYSRSESGLMRQTDRPAFLFFVFDVLDTTGRRPFTLRWQEAEERAPAWPPNVGLVHQELVPDQGSLLRFEGMVTDMGYEGVMLRRPESRYKQGRATLSENSLLKVKRFLDGEAEIIGVEELMTNTNPAMRNPLGRTQRSTARAGLVGTGTLGALIVRGLPGQPLFAGVKFNIGTGFDEQTRAELWRLREKLPGVVVKYRHFAIGAKDKPRHPVFVGFRRAGT